MEVDNAMATLIPRGELAKAKGVSWTASELKAEPTENRFVPALALKATEFSQKQIQDFAKGDAYGCFGEAFEALKSHQQSPHISNGQALQLDEVLSLDTQGGPAQLGYMKATRKLSPDEWFFKAHFKGDPCMPAALIGAGCFQAMNSLFKRYRMPSSLISWPRCW